VGALVYTAVDHKPKRTTALQRLADITANPAVALLVDHYEEDWSRLWWVRLDGRARVLDELPAAAVAALAAKYPQYAALPPAGPGVEISVSRVLRWSASSAAT
jgi:PPOX class probable F420-dependent enzyme